MLTGTLEGWKKWMLMTEAEQKNFAKKCDEEYWKRKQGR